MTARAASAMPILPAEWSPQSGVMVTWPHTESDWAPVLPTVEPVFATIAAVISRFESVLIVCRDEAHRRHIATFLERTGVRDERLRLHLAASNDTWARDHGPITVFDGDRPLLLDFVFNGWGGKYPADLDNRINRALHAAGAFGAVELRQVDFVLEGGSIDSDGAGTLLTTTSCLLKPTRNPGQTRLDIEAALKRYLGIARVLWLQHGYLSGDDTDSHVDMLARFCDRRTIAHVSCDDPGDEHYGALQQMTAELCNMSTIEGEPYRLIPLPLPTAKYDYDGRRLPASYANFLIINDAVLVPQYDDPADTLAMARLADCFPGREMVPIPALPLIQQNGSLHCLTMQLPRGVL